MSRYIGNYLRVPSLEPQQSSAPGIWSISEQLNYQRANLWPPARDPYYNQTVLHLSGDVAATRETNPVTQPRTFLSDASTNNFLLTPYGDVSARPFSPYLENYSGYAPGNCYLDIASNSGFNLSDNANFTIEFWINCPATSGALWIASGWQNTSNLSWSLSWRSNNAIEFYGRQSSGGAGTIYYINNSGDNTVLPNTWTHYAVVRNSSTISVYVNGNLINTGTINGTPAPSTNCRFFGDSLNGSQLTGYISNFRFSRSAVYTQPFTPATQPLTTTSQGASNVVFLGFNKNRFVDVANNLAFTFTSGNPAISANSPFVSLDTTSGSGYFDGSGDFLSLPDNAALNPDTSDFTIEAWIYPISTSSLQVIHYKSENDGTGVLLAINNAGAGKVNFYIGNSGSWIVLIDSSTLISTNSWYHIAGTRSGNTYTLWLNGLSVGTATNAGSPSVTANDLRIGRWRSALPYDFNGYISNYRLVKGTAVYTGPFTPPTKSLARSGTDSAASYTSTTNVNTSFPASATSLLTLQTRAPANNQGILDTSPNNFVVTRTGNVAQGSFSPFSQSGWSNYFNGYAGTNLSLNPGTTIGAGQFSVESWIYPQPQPASGQAYVAQTIIFQGNNNNNNSWSLSFDPSTMRISWGYYGAGTTVSASYLLSFNTWSHVLVTRDSSNIERIFINGILVNQRTSTQSYTGVNGTTIRLGSHLDSNWPSAYSLNQFGLAFCGYMSNTRVIAGNIPAEYQTTSTTLGAAIFTPSTSRLTNVAGTILLANQSNRFIDNSSYNSAITINYSTAPGVSVQPFSPFAPTQAYVASQLGGSAYFDSSGDSLTVPSAPALNMTGDFCMEAWAYPTTAGISFAWKYTAGVVSTSEYFWAIDGTNQLSVALDGGGGEDYFRTAANTITLNAWNHCVITRVGTAVRQFINGVLQSYNTTSRTLNTTSTNFSTSANSGYISGLRIMKGSIPDMYQTTATTTGTTAFIPPTTPLTNVPGTSLLLNFTGAGIVDASGKHTIETVGNAHKSTAQARFTGTGADYYDGTSDYLTIRDNPLLELGSANFTIEAWVYPLNNSSRSIFGHGPDGQNWWAFYLDGTGKLEFAIVSGNSVVVDRISSTTVNTNTWTHVAVTRSGSTFRLFIDGQEPASYTGSPATTSAAAPDFSTDFWIGGQRWSGSGNSFQGYIQDLRVTRGIARYTSNFTPPTRTLELG